MNTVYFLVQQTMFFSIPLLIVALGGMFSERSGVVNIALEGIMIMGAFSSILFINIVQSSGAALPPQLLLLLAVLIFGQWRPSRILFAAFFFGLMKTVASAYSGIPFLANLGIPNDVYKMVPYVATLIVLAFTSKNSMAPRAEGIPYDKGSR